MSNIVPVTLPVSTSSLFRDILRAIRSSDLEEDQADAAWAAAYAATSYCNPRLQDQNLQLLYKRLKALQEK